LEAPEHLVSDDVAGDADDEQLVRHSLEDHLGRHTCVSAAEERGERLLCRGASACAHAEKTRIARDDQRRPVRLLDTCDEPAEASVALFEKSPGGVTVRRRSANERSAGVEAVDDIQCRYLLASAC